MAKSIPQILYVDDEKDLLDIGKLLIEENGDFEVTTATNVTDAVKLLEQKKFNVIISDYEMPKITGLTFLKNLKSDGDTTPFILFTGRGREEVVIQAINLGVDFYVQKSGDPEVQFAELIHHIRQSIVQKATEESHKFTNLILATQMETSPDGILIISETGKILSYNHHFIDMWGASKAILLTKSDKLLIKSILPKLIDPDAFLSNVEQIYGDKLAKTHDEVGLVDGRIFDRHSSPLIGEDKTYLGRIWYFRDITFHKTYDQNLNREHEFTNSIMDSLPGLFCIFSYPDGKLIRWNKQLVSVLGYTPEELMQRSVTDWVTEDKAEQSIATLNRIMKNGHGELYLDLLTKDGRLIPYLLSGSKLESEGKTFIIGFGVDITDRKQKEVELRLMSERLIATEQEFHSVVFALKQQWDGLKT